MRCYGWGSQMAERSMTKDPREDHELIRKEGERLEAIKQGDIESLGRMYAPEYTAVFSLNPGRAVSKVEELALQGPQSRRLQSWEPSDVKVRVYGLVGLVTGVACLQDVWRGKERHIHSQYTHIWVKRDGDWQLVHRHINRMATPENTYSYASTGAPQDRYLALCAPRSAA
jgi:ketosteroid isomerase-like protein